MIPPWMGLLLACTEPDTDGTRWDPTGETWWSASGDTASTPTDTVEDTAPPAPTGDTGTAATDLSCNGEGAASLDMGHGGRSAFTPYNPGDDLPIVVGPDSGEWGVTLEILTAGLDTTESVSTVMRVVTAETDTTYIGVLLLQCPSPGPGWVALHADFPDEDQAAAGAGSFDGDPAEITLTVTDHTDEYATVVRDVVLTGP